MADLLTAGDIIRTSDLADIDRRLNAIEGRRLLAEGSGLAFDSNGRLYIVDDRGNRIIVTASTGAFLFTWGSSGTGNGEFDGPVGIAIDAFDNVYICDSLNNRVQKFEADGTYTTQWGSLGSGNGEFNNLEDCAIVGSSIFVTDKLNDRVQKFSLTGTYQDQFGTTGSGDDNFTDPKGIALESGGTLLICDAINDRIKRHQTSGTFIGETSGSLVFPRSVALDGSGNFYVADQTADLAKFNSSMAHVDDFTMQHSLPYGVVVGGDGNVYACNNGGDAAFAVVMRFTSLGVELNHWGKQGTGGTLIGGSTFYRYPTMNVGDKESAGTPDGGVSVPAYSFYDGNIIRSNEINDARDALEAVALEYTNVVTGNDFTWSDSNEDNLYHVAVKPNQYNWDRPLPNDLKGEVIRIDELNELDACITVLESSDVTV